MAATLFAAGCASTDHSGHGRHADVVGMECPKCEAVWIGPRAPVGASAKSQTLHWGRQAVCPDAT